MAWRYLENLPFRFSQAIIKTDRKDYLKKSGQHFSTILICYPIALDYNTKNRIHKITRVRSALAFARVKN
jgi:hypothetical protein